MSDDLIILIESDETVIAEIAEQGPTGPEGPTGPPGEVEEHTHDAADVNQDETHRFVTDAEKTAWTAKQDALGYTPVNAMDARLSDARAPTAHAASHATGGTDAITPAGIGASEAGHDHDETYAPLAKGVTNGDTHDHSGGDGGQIAFSSLGAKPTTLAGYGITDAAAAADLSGKADLVNGLVPASQLPSYVDDVLEYANLGGFPAEGETGKIYVALDNNLTYRWTGTVYGVLNPSLALGETMDTAYRGDRGKTAYDHSQSAHDYAPSSHVGTGGTAHAVATESVAGFMTSADKVKLNTASLTALSGLTPAASKIPYFSGADSAALADITATGISLLGAANAAGARTTLELGTVATQAADSVSLTGGSISGMTSISGSTLTSTVATGTAPLTITSTTLVTNLNTDTVDGFHASKTPAANQIPVLNSAGRLVLDGTDDGSSKIQTGGNIKAGNNLLMGGELIGPSSLKIHPNTSDGADSGVSYVSGGGWPMPSRGGFLEVRGNESASFPGDVRIISGGDSTFGNVSLFTGGGYERFRITPSGRILAGPTLPTDNGVDTLQVNGTIASKGIKLSDTNEIKWGDGSCKISGSGSTDIITLTGSQYISSNLGIGVTPSYPLHIKGTAATDQPTYSAEFLDASNWTSTGWTGSFATGWSHTTGNTNTLVHDHAAVSDTKYQIAYTVTGRTAGTFTISFGGQTSAGISATGAWGPTATATDNLSITPTSDFNGTIIISIKSITGVSTPLIVGTNSSGGIAFEARAPNASLNAFFGKDAGKYNTTGLRNVANGYAALHSNTTGSDNVANGYAALYSNTTGSGNVANGCVALYSNTTGSGNVANGNLALRYNTTGSFNVANGYMAGQFISGGSVANTTPSNSVYLGALTKASADGNTNEIVIGYNTTGMGSNTAILGNSGITHTYLRGQVLIGTTTSDGVNNLQVNGTIASKGYKLSALNTAPASASAAGTLGEIRITADAIYICTATNTWKKVAIATW